MRGFRGAKKKSDLVCCCCSVFYGQSYHGHNAETGLTQEDTALLSFRAATLPEFLDQFPAQVSLGSMADRFTTLFNQTSGTVVCAVLNWVVLYTATIKSTKLPPVTQPSPPLRGSRSRRRRRGRR